MIDRLPWPFPVAGGRRWVMMGGLKCPELLRRFKVDPLFLRSDAVARIRGALLNPGHKVRNHLVGKLSSWRHLKVLIAKGLQQQACRRIARNDCRASLAAFADAITAVQKQSASDLLRAGRVTFI